MATPATLRTHVMSPPPNGDVLAECGCKPLGDPRPAYVEVSQKEVLEGWTCPH
jgi:hypothetical protein